MIGKYQTATLNRNILQMYFSTITDLRVVEVVMAVIEEETITGHHLHTLEEGELVEAPMRVLQEHQAEGTERAEVIIIVLPAEITTLRKYTMARQLITVPAIREDQEGAVLDTGRTEEGIDRGREDIVEVA